MTDVKALAKALEGIQKTHGDEFWHNVEELRITTVPTGLPNLDYVIGRPGIPRGRITIFVGAESAGKSLLSLTISANCVKSGLTVLYLDFENTLEPDHLSALGVVIGPKFLVFRPNTLEAGFEIAMRLVQSGGVDLVVFDSVAAMLPRTTSEREVGNSMPGSQSRALSICLQQFLPVILKHDCACLMVNQMRSVISTGYGHGPTQQMAGGNALRYYAHVIIRLWRTGQLKDGSHVVGMEIGAEATKNKVGKPYRQTTFRLAFGSGIDVVSAVANSLEVLGIVSVSAGGWIDSKALGIHIRGRQNFIDLLRDDSALLRKCAEALLTHESGAATAAVVTDEDEPISYEEAQLDE